MENRMIVRSGDVSSPIRHPGPPLGRARRAALARAPIRLALLTAFAAQGVFLLGRADAGDPPEGSTAGGPLLFAAQGELRLLTSDGAESKRIPTPDEFADCR